MSGVPLDDRGLLLGDGLFETLLVRDGRLILFDAHLDRMTAGCGVLGLPAPDADDARRLCEAALRDAGLEAGDAAVRLTLTAGSGGRGLDRPAAPRPRLLAAAAPISRPRGPLVLATASVRRNQGSPASRLKTLSYLDNVLARREAAPAEALMLNTAGQVACAAIGNLYWVEGEVVHTPALDCGVLAGVMRAEILRRAPGLGIRILEVRAPAAALAATPAMAMSNSLAGLRRIASLDGRALRGHPLLDRLAADLADVSWSW